MNLHRRPTLTPARVVLAVALCLVVAVGLIVAVVVTLGVDGALRLAGALALMACASVAASVAALSMVLRRRLGELRHLPDLGRRFETHHDGVHLTDITTTADGTVALLATDSARTVVLDESGTPDQVRCEGPGDLKCAVSNTDARRLQHAAEAGAVVTLTTTGVIGLTGPVCTGWRIQTAPGPAGGGG